MTSFSGDYFNRKLVKHNTLCKNVSKMKWVFVSGQTSDSFVTVFSVRNGFRVQVYDSDPFKLRCETATITSGDPTPYDSLCVSATTSKIVVGGMQSQTVWVFKMKEELLDTGQKENSSLIWKLLSRSTNKGKK